MPQLRIKLADGTAYDIVSFNDTYVGTATGDMEKADEMQYRTICHLADYSVTMADVVRDFTDDNMGTVEITYGDGSSETVKTSYENMHLERVNKYFSMESGSLSSGYDVVLGKE